MEIFRILFLLALLSATGIYPESTNDLVKKMPNPGLNNTWVYDNAGVIDDTTREQINSLIDELEKSSGNEIVVAVLASTDGNDPREVAVELFNYWKIGKKDKDNGILVLHAVDQRRIEIETGYGMEGIVPDVKCKWIIDEITIPAFKQSRFSFGHLETTRALIRAINKPGISREELLAGKSLEITEDGPATPDKDGPGKSLDLWVFFILFLFSLPGVLMFLHFINLKKNMELKKTAGEKLDYLANITFWFFPISFFMLFVIMAIASLTLEKPGNIAVPSAILCIFILPYYVRKKVLSRFRTAPRKCTCGLLMRKQDVKVKNTILQPGQLMEEKIKSMDYDVWQCSCGAVTIEQYTGKKPAEKCPACSWFTLYLLKSDIVSSPEPGKRGLARDQFNCHFCNHNTEKERILHYYSGGGSGSSSRSSGGGSSGGGGGRSGGGSSGGGGSGGSY